MRALTQLLGNTRSILALQQENKQLRKRVAELEQQNDSMRAGMRRCLTCDYRLESRRDDRVSGSP